MSPLEKANRLAEAFAASLAKIADWPCQFCNHRSHLDECPLLAVPEIAEALAAALQGKTES